MLKNKIMKKFTINEIRNYLLSQDSMGDILYNLSEENIAKANKKEPVGENEYGQYLCDEIDDAIRQFGQYTYDDKGADEVMDIDKYVKDLNEMSAKQIAEVMIYLLDNNENAEMFMNCVLGEMEEKEDFDDIFEYDDRIGY